MRSFDFSPLYRSTVGFDRLFGLLDAATKADDGAPTYPPYNIEVRSEDRYRVTMAVAGFSRDEIQIETQDGSLVISGKHAADATSRSFLHRGIAGRGFERRFELADHVRVEGASLENGLLHVDLVRELPEAAKPRRVEIQAGSSERVIEADRKVA